VKKRSENYYLEWSGEISGSAASGKFQLDFRPNEAENLISADDFNQKVKLQLQLPRIVSTLESLFTSRIDLEIYIDLSGDSNGKVNFMGRSNGYKIRLEQQVEKYECQ